MVPLFFFFFFFWEARTTTRKKSINILMETSEQCFTQRRAGRENLRSGRSVRGTENCFPICDGSPEMACLLSWFSCDYFLLPAFGGLPSVAVPFSSSGAARSRTDRALIRLPPPLSRTRKTQSIRSIAVASRPGTRPYNPLPLSGGGKICWKRSAEGNRLQQPGSCFRSNRQRITSVSLRLSGNVRA